MRITLFFSDPCVANPAVLRQSGSSTWLPQQLLRCCLACRRLSHFFWRRSHINMSPHVGLSLPRETLTTEIAEGFVTSQLCSWSAPTSRHVKTPPCLQSGVMSSASQGETACTQMAAEGISSDSRHGVCALVDAMSPYGTRHYELQSALGRSGTFWQHECS